MFRSLNPSLEIDLNRLRENILYEKNLLDPYGIRVMGVNKVFNGLKSTAKALVDAGIEWIAESRLENLEKISGLKCKKVLLRSPLLSEIAETVRLADLALVTELAILKALAVEAKKQSKGFEVLLMIDMGDLREGIWFENFSEILSLVQAALASPELKIYGIGTNFNCFGAIKPSAKKIEDFCSIVKKLEAHLNFHFPIVSGGNCTSFHLIHKGQSLHGINELRIGGLHQFGIEYVDTKYVEGFHHSKMPIERVVSDLYQLRAEVIEVNIKPTVPHGEAGVDAFLKVKKFSDRGLRRRAILALGRQDLPAENIWPIDESIFILGQTSDHTIVEIHDSRSSYPVGSVIAFEIDYTALLHACQSPSIKKTFRGVEID